MTTNIQRELIGGGFKLLLFGTAIYILIAEVIMRQIELIYPYITYKMVDAIYIYLLLCFAIPGVLLFPMSYFAKYFDLNMNIKMPPIIKSLYVLTGILTIVSILGIRIGVKIFISLNEIKKENTSISHETNIKEEGVRTYRLYMISSGIYLLVFGLFFLALINFLLVLTILLLYPTVNQLLMIGLEIWFWVCFISPAILFLFFSIFLNKLNNPNYVKIQKKGIKFASILAIGSIFGLSAGINLLRNGWMLDAKE